LLDYQGGVWRAGGLLRQLAKGVKVPAPPPGACTNSLRACELGTSSCAATAYDRFSACKVAAACKLASASCPCVLVRRTPGHQRYFATSRYFASQSWAANPGPHGALWPVRKLATRLYLPPAAGADT